MAVQDFNPNVHGSVDHQLAKETSDALRRIRKAIIDDISGGSASVYALASEKFVIIGPVSSDLSAERVLAVGAGGSLVLVDGGANGNVTLTRAALTGDVSASADSNTLTLASIISAAGPIGSATVVPIITYDAKGRLTAVSSVAIQIAESQVTNLVADLAAIITAINGKQPLDATLTSLAAVSGVQGDLFYADGSDTWTRLAKDANATRYLSNTGSSNNPAWAQVNLTNGVTGALPVANGGNALTSIAALSLLVANSANVYVALTPGAGNSIRINAGGTAWEAYTPGAGTPTAITVANEATDTTCFPLFVTAVTGDLGPKTNANLTFDSANGNLGANAIIPGYTTTATAAGTTTLTIASDQTQFFTGSTTQTCQMPATSTLVTGFTYRIVNKSTGLVTINSSGGNQIIILPPETEATLIVINTGVTTAAGWQVLYKQNASGVIVFRAGDWNPPATSFAEPRTVAGTSTPAENFSVFAYDQTGPEYMDFKCLMSPKYAGGGITLRLKVGGASASNNIRMGAAFRRIEDGDDLDTTVHNYDYNDSADTAAPGTIGMTKNIDIAFTNGSDMDSVAAGEWFILRVRRTAATSNMAADAYLYDLWGLEA